jgi:hypothetical protein
MDELRGRDVLNTWTDELNAALAPFGILLSGADAASILPSGDLASPYDALRAYAEDDFVAIAKQANEDCSTDRIRTDHIRDAVRRTLWHWDER